MEEKLGDEGEVKEKTTKSLPPSTLKNLTGSTILKGADGVVNIAQKGITSQTCPWAYH